MKKLIFLLLIIMITLPSYSAPKKEHLPFAPKGKYGKMRTKQCKPNRQKVAWIHRQWGRN